MEHGVLDADSFLDGHLRTKPRLLSDGNLGDTLGTAVPAIVPSLGPLSVMRSTSSISSTSSLGLELRVLTSNFPFHGMPQTIHQASFDTVTETNVSHASTDGRTSLANTRLCATARWNHLGGNDSRQRVPGHTRMKQPHHDKRDLQTNASQTQPRALSRHRHRA